MSDTSHLPPLLAWLALPYAAYALYWAIPFLVATAEMVAASRSQRTPIGPRLRVNFAFGLFTALLYSLPWLSEVLLAQWIAARGWGLLANTGLTPGWQVVLGFLAYDLCGYAIHRLSHRSAWLWRLHRVHHADADLDLSTYFRSHPLDVLLIVALRASLIVALGILPLAILLYGLAKQATMALGHANLPALPRVSRTTALLVVSPAFHARHHSAHQRETDSNYGEVLTVWDRLFGTAGAIGSPIARFGLGDAYDAQATSLRRQFMLPFVGEKEPADPPQTVVAASFRT